jgi:hypothetical protein
MLLARGSRGLGEHPRSANSLTAGASRKRHDSICHIPVTHSLWVNSGDVDDDVDCHGWISRNRLAWRVLRVALALTPMLSTELS